MIDGSVDEEMPSRVAGTPMSVIERMTSCAWRRALDCASCTEEAVPRVGDTATIAADVGDGIYLLECCTDDGVLRWMAEFAAEELALVDRTDVES